VNACLLLYEDDRYYFDAAAADRVVRFIETFCEHYEGREHAGKKFILHPEQRRIVRDLFGWKLKSNGNRRFTDFYFEGAVGAGKSPLLAAIGLYCLMADGEPAAQIYSLASTYQQAMVVFDTAKNFAQRNIELKKRLVVVEREIRHPRSKSSWRVVSGKGPGAGCKPSLILGDELHQWKSPGAYQDLRDRMFKRANPLMITATNSGESQASFAWQLRQKAVAAFEGTGEKSMYPVIWAAAEDAATDDPEAWRAANPLLGITAKEDKVRQNAIEAMKDPIEEAKFRRLNLSIWPLITAGAWLDMENWDRCVGPLIYPADAPQYVGVDLAESDDLCAVTEVYVTPDRFYVDAHFWLPRVTAERYESQHGTPYSEWAKAGHITLLEEPTISTTVREAIARRIVERAKGRKLKAVCYDRYRADQTVAVLEAGGLTCVPIAQGYSVSPGCHELDRRLKEVSITITSNPVLRFCAENVETKADDRGNIWITKPGATDVSKGTRWRKVDGIAALVTSLVEARKHSFPSAKRKFGGVVAV
jgi:phage terminase large subunit-like protein